MCEKVVKDVPWRLKYVRMGLTTQKMYKKAVEDGPWHLIHVPDHFKTQEMCEKSVEKDPWWLFPIVLRPTGCVKKPFKKIFCA